MTGQSQWSMLNLFRRSIWSTKRDTLIKYAKKLKLTIFRWMQKIKFSGHFKSLNKKVGLGFHRNFSNFYTKRTIEDCLMFISFMSSSKIYKHKSKKILKVFMVHIKWKGKLKPFSASNLTQLTIQFDKMWSLCYQWSRGCLNFRKWVDKVGSK